MPETIKPEVMGVTLDENGFIPGTTYKNVDELIKGHTELKSMADKQSNELGTIRKDHDSLKSQTETLANLLKDNLTKGNAQSKGTQIVDYDVEITTTEKEIQKLDPMDKDYQTTLASLIAKTNKLSAAAQHEKTLSVAANLMQKELGERDVKSAQQRFYDENPTFNTPEMQSRIKEKLAQDRTGMSDPLVAFREIEKDDISAKAQMIAAENAELKKILELSKGKGEAGKVVTRGQGPGQQESKPVKVTGAALDQGMREALSKVNTG